MTIQDLIKNNVSTLRAKAIESALLDTQLLLAHVLNVDKDYIILHPNDVITPEQEKRFQALIRRRAHHEPTEYITNKAHFYGLEFYVDKNVLIPRPDTEILIETVLDNASHEKPIIILDIGTGSGCIAISLAKYLPYAAFTAIDISLPALNIAKQNAKNNNVSNINFLQHDITKEFISDFDIIVSNPPYIPTHTCCNLMPEVSNFEPRVALDGGADGLNFYRLISKFAASHLAANGLVALEIGQNQEHDIEKIFNQNSFVLQSQTKDLAGIIRVLVFKK